MIKKLLWFFVLIVSIKGYAQQGTASPYSFYGIGSLKFKGTVENRSMGGLSIYTDSVHVNLRNPASYAGENLRTFNFEGRPVKFSVAGSHSAVGLKSDASSGSTTTSTFDYMALSIPVGKFGFGFGLLPYSSVGHKLETLNDDNEIADRFNGEGGVNRVYFSGAYLIVKGLSIGADINYNFGNISNKTISFIYDPDGELLLTQTREDSSSDLSGVNLNLGLSYKAKISDKLELTSGLIYSLESSLTSNNERSLSTISISSQGIESVIGNSLDVDLSASGLDKTDLVLPSKISFGLGVGEPTKWFAGLEYTMLNTSDFSNPFYKSNTITFEDASAISLGGFYVPKFNAFSNYFKRVVYRAGLHYEETGLNINSEAINEFGISFGVGLPVGTIKSFSSINLGFEIGKRGTTNSNLIQENFFNLHIGLSLNDRWFVKRKYN